jgi:nitrite reductase/ring-hydroxylating ferredoxin subunit
MSVAQPRENWVTVAEKSALTPDSAIGVTVGKLDIAIYNVGGELYATDNICPHAYGYLNHGWLEGDIIECPLHGARFEVKTGKGIDGPFECDLKTFAVRVVGEEIQVEVPADSV